MQFHAEEFDDAAAPDVTPPPLPSVAPRARFCGTCGAEWQIDWTRCESCAAEQAFHASRAAADPVAVSGEAGDAIGIIGIRSAVALYFTLLAVSLVLMFAVIAGASVVPVELAGSVAISVVVLAWCAATDPRAVVRLLKPAAPKWYPIALGGAVCTFAVAVMVIGAMHQLVGLKELDYSHPYLHAGYGMWLVVLVICVQPAVFEELAFRGVVLSSLRPTLSDVEAVFVSAMLFMTLHLTPAAFPHTLAMGLAAGFIRLRSRSILPCMLLHFTHNAAVVAAEHFGWNF